MHRNAKYYRLHQYLRRQRGGRNIVLSFAEVETILNGILPHRAGHILWWSNDRHEERATRHNACWLDAGFHATPRLDKQIVTFTPFTVGVTEAILPQTQANQVSRPNM